MGTEVNEDRIKASIKLAEKDGPLPSQDQLWITVAEIYNSGEGLPKKYADRPKEAISKSMVYQTVRRNRIAVKTPKRKVGRPTGTAARSGTEAMRGILDFLQAKAIEEQWRSDDEGWNSINSARKAVGKGPVDPVDGPTVSHFA